MTQNLERQAKLIATLAATLPTSKEPDEAFFLGYELGLIGVPTDVLEQAVARALQTCKFMPSPAELRELAGCAVGDSSRPLLAWEAFRKAVGACGAYRSVDFDDPAINATVRALGGWERACDLEGDAFYVWYRKEFERTYATLCESGFSAEMGMPLIGSCESAGQEFGFGCGDDAKARIETGLFQRRISVEQKLISQEPR